MQFDFNLAAGQSQTIDVSGRFFKYKSGTGVIRVRASAGGYVDLLPGQGVWNIEFTSLTVTDKSNAANAGVLVAGAFDFRDDRIVGAVEVNDVISKSCEYKTMGGGAPLGDTVSTILAPAQNPNGLAIRQFKIYASSASAPAYTVASLFASTDGVALAYATSRPNTLLLGNATSGGGVAAYQDVAQISRRIPAGWGLYAMTTSGNTAGSFRVDVSIEVT